MGKSKHSILLVDDDVFFANYVADLLIDRCGYLVTQSYRVEEALEWARRRKFSLVIVDLKMPPGKGFDSLTTLGGHRTGLVFAREIKRLSPTIKVLVHSAAPDLDLGRASFDLAGATFIPKSSTPAELVRTVKHLLDPNSLRSRSFIVHGNDNKTALELKNYLQNRLGFDEPTILAEQPSRGATMIEKFEAYAAEVDWVLVLLTPDDIGQLGGRPESMQARAMQNVIFELGYFHGLMQRRSGRIVLLYKGALEIPSDLTGVAYIDITQGIEAAGEDIRRNLVRKFDPVH